MKVTARIVVTFEISDDPAARREEYGEEVDYSPAEAALHEAMLLSVSHEGGQEVRFTIAIDPVPKEWPS